MISIEDKFRAIAAADEALRTVGLPTHSCLVRALDSIARTAAMVPTNDLLAALAGLTEIINLARAAVSGVEQ